jgi:hypothetical protein
MVVAMIALFVGLGGSALGYGMGRDGRPGHSSGKYTLRAGKIVDTDTTAGDGLLNVARGHANCKRGERLISGGLRVRGGNVFGGHQVSMVESGPVPKRREWAVAMNSDLGGAARRDFAVFAYCRSR